MVLAQASIVANAAGTEGKYTPRNSSQATISSFWKSIRANQETGLIDPALVIAARKTAQTTTKDANFDWSYTGPDNFGGLTRAVIYDKDKNLVIGTMGGDLYKTTNGGITFRKITNMSLTISSMVMNDNGDIFVGTGDGRNAHMLNGLVDMGDEASFAGDGIYKMAAGTTELVSLTATRNWKYVNELAIAKGKIYAATEEGLKVSADNGETWSEAVAGNFRSVKANKNGDVLAADTMNVYLAKSAGEFTNILSKIDNSNNPNKNPKIIAVAPNDAQCMYVAFQKTKTISNATQYYTGNIYNTLDGGDTWQIALAQTNLYPIFGTSSASSSDGMVTPNGFMAVYPNNSKKLLIGYKNLWVLEGDDNNNFKVAQISLSVTSPLLYMYLHEGIQNIVFHPTKPDIFFVGTNGGVYKGTYTQGNYQFMNSNRYFITDDQHCSTTRMMSVGVGGTNKILGGCLDHGTIKIDRLENVNNITTGIAVFPNPDMQSNANEQFGFFQPAYAGGTCAISTISPDIMFVSGTGDLSEPIHRTETNGEDYDIDKFNHSSIIANSGVFKTPFALYENYNELHKDLDVYKYVTIYDTIDYTVYDSLQYIIDTTGGVIDTTEIIHIHDSIWNVNIYRVVDTVHIDFDTLLLAHRDTLYVGDTCFYYSNIAKYPLYMTVPELPDSLINPAHLNGQIWLPKDTIRGLHDSLSSIMVIGLTNKVYMTRDALLFNKNAEWFLLSTITGIPSAVALSSDGDFALVGTLDGKIYKFPRLSEIFVSEQVTKTDTLNYIYSDITDFLLTTIPNQAITSISIDPDPNHKDHIVVTLGNYKEGNKYVYVSNDGEHFDPVAGNNLPASPVYSSIIEKDSKAIIVGTEFGIYVSEDNGANFTKSGSVSSPVMDIKQAIVPNHADRTDVMKDEMGVPTYILYPGVSNCGMIFAATYGEGALVCNPNAEANNESGDNNDNLTTVNADHLNVYPNPVRNNAQVSVKLDNAASVSYVIYDLSGRVVIKSEVGTYNKGTHTVNINTSNLSNGTYIIRVNAGDKSETTKFLVY